MSSPSIHIVTPNPALDCTYTLDHLEVGEANRVRSVVRTAGGKGLNVAHVLQTLGRSATVGGFLGGPSAQEFLARIPTLEARFTLIEGTTRTTVTAVHDGGATAMNEPGPGVDHTDWESLINDSLDALGTGPALLSINGSNPPGTPLESYTELITRAKEAGAYVLVDTSGPHLRAAVAAGADLVKPNHHELAEATGTSDRDAGVHALMEDGASTVVLSLAEEGIQVHSASGPTIAARLEEPVRGNPVGAGDALVAAVINVIAGNLEAGQEPRLTPQQCADLVAISAASVREPVAGAVDLGTVDSLRPLVTVKEL
ncbi:MAG: hexose kinase [Bowdeniella nasicola]|nr:hexose kinase [Bowdeniella nasicola]